MRWPIPRRPSRLIRVNVAGRDDIPRHLRQGRAYAAGRPAKWLVMACPCRTGHRIDLNLAQRGRTQWCLADESLVTLRPSVHVRRAGEPDCHFIVRAGVVHWTSPPPPRRRGSAISRMFRRVVYALRRAVPYDDGDGEGSTGIRAQTLSGVTPAEEDQER